MVKKNLPATQQQTKGLAKKEGLESLLVADASGSNSGFEDMTSDDMAIPFISILQALSPQVRGTTKISGAEEGDFYNSVSSETYKGDIFVVPCAYNKSWVEWVPREKGGGFVKQHPSIEILNSCTKDDKGKDVLKDSGNIIVATAYHYCLLLKKTGATEKVVLALSSTQLKKSRKWNTVALNMSIEVNGVKLRPPMYSHIYKISSVEESNDRGLWAGMEISDAGLIQDGDLYLQAKKFHQDIVGGKVKVSIPSDDEAALEKTQDIF